MKYSTKIAQALLVAVVIFCIITLPAAIFNLSFAIFLLTNVPYLVGVGILSLFLSFIFGINRILGAAMVLAPAIFFSMILFVIKGKEKEDAETMVWNSPNDSFIIDFVVGSNGYIYLEASVNDTSGLFLFDTGAGISIVNERFVAVKKMKGHPFTITDSKGIKQTKDLYKVNNFMLGGIEIKRLQVYPKDSISWTEPKGFFYKKDSIIGVIGNNIISKFIWDFDLINKQVTISKSKRYCRAIPDSLSVPLFWTNGNNDIPVKINGAERMLTFDFGASEALTISDSIPNNFTGDKEKGLRFIQVEL